MGNFRSSPLTATVENNNSVADQRKIRIINQSITEGNRQACKMLLTVKGKLTS